MKTVAIIGSFLLLGAVGRAQHSNLADAVRSMPEVQAQVYQVRATGLKSVLWSAHNRQSILYGTVPAVFSVLDLTAEQTAAIEGIVRDARAERARLQAGRVPPRSDPGSRDPEAYRRYYEERQGAEQVLGEKADARAREVLTAKQRDVLAAIRDLAERKAVEDRKVQEESRAALQKIQEAYEQKLKGLLPPDKIRALEQDASVEPLKPPGAPPRFRGAGAGTPSSEGKEERADP